MSYAEIVLGRKGVDLYLATLYKPDPGDMYLVVRQLCGTETYLFSRRKPTTDVERGHMSHPKSDEDTVCTGFV